MQDYPHRVAVPRTTAVSANHLIVERDGNYILRNISFDVPRGALVGILGPSGCGKTTLMRAIVGVQKIALGSLSILNLPAGVPSLRQRIAYTTQSPAFYSDLSVEQNLQFFARIVGVGSDRIDNVLTQTSLAHLTKRVVGTLSGGEQARTSLAIALLPDADVLILDEPTVGLDPLLRIDLWRLFADLSLQGKTLLVSSHVLDEATHCDQLILMREGQILSAGTPRELCESAMARTVEEAFVAFVKKDMAKVS